MSRAALDLLTECAPALRRAGVREIDLDQDGKVRRAVFAPPDPEPSDNDGEPAAPTDTDPLYDPATFGRSKVPGSALRRGDDDDEG